VALHRTLTNKPLAAMMNTLEFILDGYNDHPDEAYAIPEIRCFADEFGSIYFLKQRI